jgi:hypothetical protein
MWQPKDGAVSALTFQDDWGAGGKVVFAGAMGLGVGVTLFGMISGVFIIPMQEEFGLSRMGASIAPMADLGGACWHSSRCGCSV